MMGAAVAIEPAEHLFSPGKNTLDWYYGLLAMLRKGDTMPKKSPIIAHLNAILKNELTAINQYFLHARILRHQGFSQLGDKYYHESIDEMKHADVLVTRILFLDGLPNLQDIGKLTIGETPEEMLRADLVMEEDNVKPLRTAIEESEQSGDFVTAELLNDILESEENHIDWLRTQLRLIDTLGIGGYLQTQV